jgi:hypothetical protein
MEHEKFITDLKEQIVDRLNAYKGSTIYGGDLAYTLFEGENANGSVFCNTWKTKEFIKENFDLFGELIKYWSDNVGESLNPFSEPERCHVILLMESAQSVLSACQLVEQKWNDKIELTDAMIKKLKKQVMEFDGDLF